MSHKTVGSILKDLRVRYVTLGEEARTLEEGPAYDQNRRRRNQVLAEISRIENGGIP